MYKNPAINFHGWSDPVASFDRLVRILFEKSWDRCCNFLCAKRMALRSKEENLSYGQKRKQRRVGDGVNREVTLSKAEVFKENILNQTLLIEMVLKQERMDLVLVRNGGND